MTNIDSGEFLRDRSFPLRTLDPREPLDDLEPLLDLIGTARVVAVGENNHHIREFCLLRHRILRLLVERAGFSVYGFESGFAEGQLVDAWVRGGAGEVAEIASAGIGFSLGESAEVHDTLCWMRARAAEGDPPLAFAGLDVPGSAGPQPAHCGVWARICGKSMPTLSPCWLPPSKPPSGMRVVAAPSP